MRALLLMLNRPAKGAVNMKSLRMDGNTERRNFCKTLPGLALGIGGVAAGLSSLQAQEIGHDSHQEGEIYELQAAFHLAKSTQDIDLLMSLWDVNGSLTISGDPNSPYVGFDRLKAFLLSTGSFTHRRLSLVPSFKIQIDIHGKEAFFYEECHDVQDFDLPTRFIAADSFLAGTVRKIKGKWLFSNMFGGSANPLSVDHYYFP
jgi:hypothetical protein